MHLPWNEITLPVEPFISAGGVIVAGMVAGCFGLLSIWLKVRLDNIGRSAGRAASRADDAASLSTPTGNGYAARTEATLGRIESRLDLIDTRVDRAVARLDAHLDERKTA